VYHCLFASVRIKCCKLKLTMGFVNGEKMGFGLLGIYNAFLDVLCHIYDKYELFEF